MLGSVAALAGASAAAGAGTMAAFSDEATSGPNAVSTGTLDLELDGADGTVQFLSETEVAPGDSGQATVTLSNTGSLTGYVDVTVASLTSYENGLVGNENAADSSGGDPGPGNGELQDYLEVHAELQGGPALWTGYDVAANRLTPGTEYDLDYELPGGATVDFVFDWQLPESAGNDAQSDGLEFALTFSLDQQADGGT